MLEAANAKKEKEENAKNAFEGEGYVCGGDISLSDHDDDDDNSVLDFGDSIENGTSVSRESCTLGGDVESSILGGVARARLGTVAHFIQRGTIANRTINC